MPSRIRSRRSTSLTRCTRAGGTSTSMTSRCCTSTESTGPSTGAHPALGVRQSRSRCALPFAPIVSSLPLPPSTVVSELRCGSLCPAQADGGGRARHVGRGAGGPIHRTPRRAQRREAGEAPRKRGGMRFSAAVELSCCCCFCCCCGGGGVKCGFLDESADCDSDMYSWLISCV